MIAQAAAGGVVLGHEGLERRGDERRPQPDACGVGERVAMLQHMDGTLIDPVALGPGIGGLGEGHLDQIEAVELIVLVQAPVADGEQPQQLLAVLRDPGAADGLLVLLARLGIGLYQDANTPFYVLPFAHSSSPR